MNSAMETVVETHVRLSGKRLEKRSLLQMDSK